MTYESFLARKSVVDPDTGLKIIPDLNPMLFPHQADMVRWALRRGRAIQLWSNPGDVVFDPFSGVGSTGYQAIKMGRKFVGSELKQSYFAQACKNIESASAKQVGLFDDVTQNTTSTSYAFLGVA